MVKISYDTAKNQLNLVEAYKDHLEQIAVISIFFGSLLVLNLYYLLTSSAIPTPYGLWLGIFLLIELYYIFPTTRLRLDLEKNVWIYQRLVFAIPIKQVLHKISDISKFVVFDSVNRKPSSSKWAIHRTKYIAAFQIWLFADNASPQDKISLFSHTTYANDSHQRQISLYSGLAESLHKIFDSVSLPLDFDAIREVTP